MASAAEQRHLVAPDLLAAEACCACLELRMWVLLALTLWHLREQNQAAWHLLQRSKSEVLPQFSARRFQMIRSDA
jgi:hypothetical protein